MRTAKRVLAEEVLRFRDLALEKRRVEPPPADAAARLLAEEVLAGRIKLSGWDASVDQWILRLELLARTCPELEIAPITDEIEVRWIARIQRSWPLPGSKACSESGGYEYQPARAAPPPANQLP